MYTKARIRVGTEEVRQVPIAPTPNFFEAQRQANYAIGKLREREYSPRVVELVQERASNVRRVGA